MEGMLYHDKEVVRESVEELLSLEESLQEFYDNTDVEIQKKQINLPSRMSPKWMSSCQPIWLLPIAALESWLALTMSGSNPNSHTLFF